MKWTEERLREIEDAAAEIDDEKAAMAHELRRLQLLVTPSKGATEAAMAFAIKREKMRQASSPAAADAPPSAGPGEEVRRLRYEVDELDAAHRRQYTRTLELENAREAALGALKDADKNLAARIQKARAALEAVPSCGVCRDDPGAFKTNPGKCTRCGQGA